MVKASALLSGGFLIFGVVLAVLFVAGVYAAWGAMGARRGEARRAAGITALVAAAWMFATLGAAAVGLLSFTSVPPTMVGVMAALFAIALGVGFSRVGERLARGLPLAVLVGFQGFRLPLEVLMHRAYAEGVMPVQMSYSGLNFDIVTGITAILVAGLLAAGWMPRWGVVAWNALGIALLANVVVVATLSAPLPFRVFRNEPANVWVTQAPFVWLPAVMVLLAILGHVVVGRRLRMERRAPTAAHGGAGQGVVGV